MILLLSLLLLFPVVVYIFMAQPKFGKTASGVRLGKMQRSSNYKDGTFQNLSNTPSLSDGATYYTVLKKFLFEKKPHVKPLAPLPSKKTNLLALDPNEDVLVWFGHSSYFMQVNGKKILVDPVLSGSASPLKFTTRSFPGADVYTTADIPEIDYLFISHDHWDHLDYDTILKLKPKIKKVITGLGTGAHLEYWGYDAAKIIEKDWNEEIVLGDGFKVNTTPARHFSGRGFKRNGNLWTSFVLTTPDMKIFIGGDSGYDAHFKIIGDTFGPFDLAILENGQYDNSWKYIHTRPAETVQAAIDLKAKKLLPVHWSKFSLANHAWNEPMKRIVEEAKNKNMPLLHPEIGEKVSLREDVLESPLWWETVDNPIQTPNSI